MANCKVASCISESNFLVSENISLDESITEIPRVRSSIDDSSATSVSCLREAHGQAIQAKQREPNHDTVHRSKEKKKV